jgi:hypothetical protein
MDMVADAAVDVSVKNLIFWPLMFLLVGVVWAQSPTPTQTVPTATVTVAPIQFPSPTPQQHPTNQPTAVKNPANAAPPGMVYDPALNSYHYPPRHP